MHRPRFRVWVLGQQLVMRKGDGTVSEVGLIWQPQPELPSFSPVSQALGVHLVASLQQARCMHRSRFRTWVFGAPAAAAEAFLRLSEVVAWAPQPPDLLAGAGGALGRQPAAGVLQALVLGDRRSSRLTTDQAG